MTIGINRSLRRLSLSHIIPSGMSTFRMSRPNTSWLRADYQRRLPYTLNQARCSLDFPSHDTSNLLEYPALRMIADYKYEHENLESFTRQELIYPTRRDGDVKKSDNKLGLEYTLECASRNYASDLGPELWIILEGEGEIELKLENFNENRAVQPGSFIEIPQGAFFSFHDLDGKDPVRAIRVYQSSSDPRNDGCAMI